VEKTINDVRDRKGTGNDYIPGNVFILLGEDGPRLMIQLINNLYDTEEWSRDFFEVTVIALKKKPKTTKCSDHCSQPYGTYSKDSKDTKKKEAVITSRLDLNLRKKTSKVLHLGHSIVWCWRRMEKISWTDCVRSGKCCIESRRKGISCKQ
jgi:hypothetical protein